MMVVLTLIEYDAARNSSGFIVAETITLEIFGFGADRRVNDNSDIQFSKNQR